MTTKSEKSKKESKKPASAENGKGYEHEGPVNTLLHGWSNLYEKQIPQKERIELGKKLRESCPRSEHGKWQPPKDRVSSVSLLNSQDENRVQMLIPLRYGRMMQSPFAFYRGGAVIMASDLSSAPRTKTSVQLSGDCHLSNFGVFATAERNVIFDLNDFDETLPGPFEWDLKRLAASFAIAADHNGFKESVALRCVYALAKSYREEMEKFAQMGTLDIWYDRVDFEDLVTHIKKNGRRQFTLESIAKLKEKKSQQAAVLKLTEMVDGKRRIKDSPPTTFHHELATEETIGGILRSYASSLWQSRQTLLQRYRVQDVAVKVVGVGSVGTVALIVLLEGQAGDSDHIFLQVKQASKSVLEPYLGKSHFAHCGERVVNGQRVLQAASDLFLGWTTGPERGYQYYVRQLMDVKASIPIDELDAITLEQYAVMCARVLARGHARTGDPSVIHGYLGTSDSFDEALGKFALAYEKQNQQDFESLIEAVNKGRIPVAPGI